MWLLTPIARQECQYWSILEYPELCSVKAFFTTLMPTLFAFSFCTNAHGNYSMVRERLVMVNKKANFN